MRGTVRKRRIRRLGRRTERLERQADCATARALAGATGVARQLSTTAPARVAAGGSPGRRLSDALRVEAEAAFGADLSAVRIHTGRRATEVVAAQGAEAVTAGRDVFFGPGAFSPRGAAGRELLFHELAHVLQQTGVRRADGVVEARDLRGDAPPQLRELPVKPSAWRPAQSDVIAFHTAATAGDAPARAWIDPVVRELGTPDGLVKVRHTIAAELEAGSLATQPLGARSFAYDLLKLAGWTHTAVSLLNQAFPKDGTGGLRTLTFDPAVYEALRAALGDRASRLAGWVWSRHPLFAALGATPARFGHTLWVALLGAGRSVAQELLTGGRHLADEALPLLFPAGRPGELLHDELGLATLRAVVDLDHFRRGGLMALLAEVRQDETYAGGSEALHKGVLAQRFARLLGALTPGSEVLGEYSAEGRELIVAEAPGMKQIADQAEGFWLAAAELAAAVGTDRVIEATGRTAQETLARFRLRPERAEVVVYLERVAAELLTRGPGGELPSPARWEALLSGYVDGGRREPGLVRAARSLSHSQLEQPVVATAEGRRVGGERLDVETQIVLGWLQRRLFGLIQVLEQYRRADDEGFVRRFGTPDHRIASRVRIARTLLDLGEALGANALLDVVRPVLEGHDVTQPESELALLGEWTEDDEARPAALREDFPEGHIVGLDPFSVNDLVYLFEEQYFSALLAALRAEIEAVEKQRVPERVAADRDLLVNDAITEVKRQEGARERNKPRRHTLRYLAYLWRTGDPVTVQRRVFAHPKTEAYVAGWGAGAEGHAVSLLHAFDEEEDPHVILWTFPDLVRQVELLQQQPALNLLVYEHRRDRAASAEDAPPPLTLEEVADLGLLTWWERLRAALKAGRTPAADAALATAHERLVGGREAARGELQAAGREATNLERERAAARMAPFVAAFPASFGIHEVDVDGVAYRTIRIPQRLLTLGYGFEDQVFPKQPAEIDTQAAFLWLDLAPGLLPKLRQNEVQPYDITSRFLPLAVFARGTVRALDDTEQQTFLTAEQQRDRGYVARGLTALDDEVSHLEKGVLTVQKRYGIRGVSRPPGVKNGMIEAVGGGLPVLAVETGKEDRSFFIDGDKWEVIRVERDFTYHPPYPLSVRGGIRSEVGGSLLELDGEWLTEAERGPDVLAVVRVNDGPGTVNIWADDRNGLLRRFSHAVEIQAIVKQLTELAEAVTTGMEVLLDLLELVPGPGQAAAAARVAAATLTFLAPGGEFDELLQIIRKNPLEELQGVIDELAAKLRPEAVLEFLLFGNTLFDTLKSRRSKTDPQKGLARRSTSAKLRRIVRRIAGAARGIAAAFAKLQTRLRHAGEAAQLTILGKPVAARVLRFVSDHLPRLASLRIVEMAAALLPDFDPADPADPDLLQAKARQAAAHVGGQLQAMLDELAGLEIPADLISAGEILELVLDIVANKLGGKYRLGYGAIRVLLETAGAWEGVKRTVDDGVKAAGADPNEALWHPIVHEHVAPAVDEARACFVTILWDLFHSIGSGAGDRFFRPRRAKPQGNAVKLTEDFETQPHGAFGGARGVLGAARADLAGGAPLAAGARRAAERGLGHDLSHVRLHAGARAQRLTRSVGADALTSGSHVFLRRGLRPDAGPGRRVLTHELAHVVQQTGPRPLGTRLSSAPRPGRPGRGLWVDPWRERAADRAASRAISGRARPPLDVGLGGAQGFQPAGVSALAARVLDRLSSFEDVEAAAGQVAERAAKPGGVVLSRDLEPVIANVAAGLRTAFRKPSATRAFAAPKTKDNVSTYLLGALPQAELKKIVKALAREAEKDVKEGDGVKQVLEIKVFRRALERFIYGRTGILLEIVLQTTGRGKARKLTRAGPIKSAKVSYVHLPPIHGGTRLWNQALDATWSGLTGPDRTRTRRYARAVLRQVGPSPEVWSKRSFALKRGIRRKVKDAMDASAGDPFTTADLPKGGKRDYVNPRRPADDSHNAGLRLGIFRDEEQRGKGRESHHITQYVLWQFLHNDSRDLAFPLLKEPGGGAAYPGLDASDGRPVQHSGGDRTLKIREFAKGRRGELLPTILLATPTHRRGRLHVSARASDIPGASTQSGVVRGEFRLHLTAAGEEYADKLAKAERARSPADVTDWLLEKGRRDADARDALYQAMSGTYRWMRDFMQPRLGTALCTIERDYFNDLVAAPEATDPALITREEMAIVHAAAVAHNKRVLSPGGWE